MQLVFISPTPDNIRSLRKKKLSYIKDLKRNQTSHTAEIENPFIYLFITNVNKM